MLSRTGSSAASGDFSIENRLRNDAWLNLGTMQLEPGAKQTVTTIFGGRAIGDTVIEGLLVCNAQNDPDRITCAPMKTSRTNLGAMVVATRIRLIGEKGGYSVLIEVGRGPIGTMAKLTLTRRKINLQRQYSWIGSHQSASTGKPPSSSSMA